MARAHLYRPVTDSEGNIVPNTQVTIYEAGTSQLLMQTLYAQPAGIETISNPYTTSDGVVEFYLERPQAVRVGLRVAARGNDEHAIDHVNVDPSADSLVQAAIGFRISNGPTTGRFLQASAVPGQAEWVDAEHLAVARPTPLQNVADYRFGPTYTPNLLFRDAVTGSAIVPTYDDVSAETGKPEDWSFTHAVLAPATTPIRISTLPLTLSEPGYAVFLYKILSTQAGVGAASMRIGMDDDLSFVDTAISPDLLNTWLVGYLTEIPSGSHTLAFTTRPGTDVTSRIQLGPIRVYAGGNVPVHHHPGGGVHSTALGTGAIAEQTGSTAAGGSASALGAYATAFGFTASAEEYGTAVGSYAVAGRYGLALGHHATTPLTSLYGVALGSWSSTGADDAIAVGQSASAPAARSVALGPAAATGAKEEAIALGSGAQARGLRSIALGADSTVAADHDYSVAIGPGVATTAARQIALGDATTTVVVPGSLRHTGDALIGSSTATPLGFYGQPGIPRPSITGSRGLNSVLDELLDALDRLGLIEDDTR